MAYARPVLCRLCGFPAPDGGVPVSQVDRGKLSEWCLRMMDTELDQEGLEEAVFCQFCVADMRFMMQPSICSTESVIFKTQQDKVEEYISDGLIKRCSVHILPLPTKMDTNTEASEPFSTHKEEVDAATTSSVLKCSYCCKSFSTKFARNNHVSESHADVLTFRCNLCFDFFRSSEDKLKHMMYIHKEKLTCCHCFSSFDTFEQKVSHFVEIHQDICEKFKCRKTVCNNLCFWKQDDLQTHLNNVHYDPAKLRECSLCNAMVISTSLHIQNHHKAEGVQCNFGGGCGAYFYTDVELKKHFAEVHLGLKKSYQPSSKYSSEADRQTRILDAHKQVAMVVDVLGSCIYCTKMIKSEKLTKHIEEYHKLEALRCHFSQRCPTFFKCKEDLQKHGDEVHATRKCHLCQKDVKGIRGLEAHARNVHCD